MVSVAVGGWKGGAVALSTMAAVGSAALAAKGGAHAAPACAAAARASARALCRRARAGFSARAGLSALLVVLPASACCGLCEGRRLSGAGKIETDMSAPTRKPRLLGMASSSRVISCTCSSRAG